MAVFTAISDADRLQVSRAFGLPDDLVAEGISGGVENTNYRLRLAPGGEPGWILTLLELPVEAGTLAFLFAVLDAADAAGLPVPAPCHTGDGARVVQVAGKPALVTPCLAGAHCASPTPAHCATIGGFLGGLHAGVARPATGRSDPRGLDWLLPAAAGCLLEARAETAAVASAACRELAGAHDRIAALPAGVMHGDLFRDNALFVADRLTGVIDWYNAAEGPLAFDLAIVLNDWCLDAAGVLCPDRAGALLAAYGRQRPLSATEADALPLLRRWAALRFWTSRMHSRHRERQRRGNAPAERLYAGKDPGEMAALLAQAGTARDTAVLQGALAAGGG